MSKWISVKKRLPFSGEDVLVAVRWAGRPATVDMSFVDDEGEWAMGSAKSHLGETLRRLRLLVTLRWEITHWMPLPKPPEEAK